MAGTCKILSFFVTTTAGEDETCEGNPEHSKRDAVDVAPSEPAPENDAAAEPTTAGEFFFPEEFRPSHYLVW